jgi:hypothetical protein
MSARTTIQPPDAAEGGFSPKVLLALIAAAVFGASGFLLLTAYAPELRAARGGGAHALSKSAIGYAGVVQLLQLAGEPVLISKEALARNTYPGLMVLTPQAPGALADLNTQYDRLIVLPKWAAEPDPAHPGWQANAVLTPEILADTVLPKALSGTVVTRRGGGTSQPRLSSSLALWSEAGLRAGPIDSFQTLANRKLHALVTDDKGAAVLAVAQGGHLYVLSDPDLLNTQGVHDRDTARIAASILLALRSDNRPIAFDVSATEAGGQRSLLRLAIEPPFLASTLCLLVVAAMIGVQAWFRFGPSQRAPRAIALGKTALVETGAGMVRLARREPQMARRYVQLCRQRAAAALGAAHLEGEALDAFLDRWAERVGAQERISVLGAEALEVKDILGLTLLAQKVRRWRLEVTRGS